MDEAKINDILAFWFGPLDSDGLSKPEQHGLWFKSSGATDQKIGELFGDDVVAAVNGELNTWAATDDGLLALILLLDQFTRNIYRGGGKAFAGDARALVLAKQVIAENKHLQLPLIHRVFLYLPLEHAEDLATQEQCVSLYQEMTDATGLEQISNFTRYAKAHRDVIAEFGRFPHRNALLGRLSTPAEQDHMATHGGF